MNSYNVFFYKILFLIIFFSPSLHSQWVNQQVPSDIGLLLSIDFTNSINGVSTGWMMHEDATGRAIYTTNGGINWLYAAIPDSTRALVTVQMINASTGYCAGAYNNYSAKSQVKFPGRFQYSKGRPIIINTMGIGDSVIGTGAYFLKTTNSGHSWFTYGSFPPSLSYLTGMYFINETTGFVSAERFQNEIFAQGIFKTTNGGSSWSLSYSITDTVNIRNIYFVDNNTGFGVGYDYVSDPVNTIQGLILKTTDAGNNWTKQLFYYVDNFTDVSFVNSQTGFACGVANSLNVPPAVIYKTTNSGQSWVKLTYQADSSFFEGIEFYPAAGTGIAFGEKVSFDTNYTSLKPFLVKTTDYGSSWVNYQLENSESVFIGHKMLDLNNWYISGGDPFTQAKILHTTNGGGIGIHQISAEIPKSFSLFQNYPNPFNPATKIKFSIPAPSLLESVGVRLVIYDASGKELQTLVNQQLQPGTYETEWDGTNYSSGVYYYKLIAGELAETKKMVLIK
jgi:hypothetical protein